MSLWVFVCHYFFLWFLMGPYGSLCVYMNFNGFLWFFMSAFEFLWDSIGSCRSLYVLMCPYGSL